MKLSKRFRSSPVIHYIIITLIRWYIIFAYKTTRWTIHGNDIFHETIESDKPVIYCLWHGRLIMTPMLWPRWAGIMHAIVSFHNDGELISKFLETFNFKAIRGSSGKKGRLHVVKETMRILKENGRICLTPDGPRGPRMHFNSAIVEMAIRHEAMIMPVSFSTTRGKFFNSWDKFLLPLPFGKGIVYYGEPVITNSEMDQDTGAAIEKDLEDRLNYITQQADEQAGHIPIAPAESKKSN